MSLTSGKAINNVYPMNEQIESRSSLFAVNMKKNSKTVNSCVLARVLLRSSIQGRR